MKPATQWLARDILGRRRDPRIRTERRSNFWRKMGWAAAVGIWAVLWAIWWCIP